MIVDHITCWFSREGTVLSEKEYRHDLSFPHVREPKHLLTYKSHLKVTNGKLPL